jgi:hypothetical protein
MDARFTFSALAGVFCAVLIIATVTTFRHISTAEHGRNQPFSAAAARSDSENQTLQYFEIHHQTPISDIPNYPFQRRLILPRVRRSVNFGLSF